MNSGALKESELRLHEAAIIQYLQKYKIVASTALYSAESPLSQKFLDAILAEFNGLEIIDQVGETMATQGVIYELADLPVYSETTEDGLRMGFSHCKLHKFFPLHTVPGRDFYSREPVGYCAPTYDFIYIERDEGCPDDFMDEVIAAYEAMTPNGAMFAVLPQKGQDIGSRDRRTNLYLKLLGVYSEKFLELPDGRSLYIFCQKTTKLGPWRSLSWSIVDTSDFELLTNPLVKDGERENVLRRANARTCIAAFEEVRDAVTFPRERGIYHDHFVGDDEWQDLLLSLWHATLEKLNCINMFWKPLSEEFLTKIVRLAIKAEESQEVYSNWEELKLTHFNGISDRRLRNYVDSFVGFSTGTFELHDWWLYHAGSAGLELWISANPEVDNPTLEGKALLSIIRKALQIKTPEEVQDRYYPLPKFIDCRVEASTPPKKLKGSQTAPQSPTALVFRERIGSLYQLPEVLRVTPLYCTDHKVRISSMPSLNPMMPISQRSDQSVWKADVFMLPDDQAWDKFVELYSNLQKKLNELSAKLRQLGRYSDRLAAAGGFQKAPNPLCATLINAPCPDTTGFSHGRFTMPSVERKRVTKRGHMPKQIEIVYATESGLTTVVHQSKYWYCPDDESWQDIQSARQQAVTAKDNVAIYLTELGFYAP